MSNPTGGLQREITLRREPVWCRKATDCIIWLTAPASPGSSARADLRHLDRAFPVLMKQLELMLSTGELNPRHSHSVMLFAKG